jgi:hypothetical protein
MYFILRYWLSFITRASTDLGPDRDPGSVPGFDSSRRDTEVFAVDRARSSAKSVMVTHLLNSGPTMRQRVRLKR